MTAVYMVVAGILAVLGWGLSLAGLSGTWLILAGGVGLDVLVDGSWSFVATSVFLGLLCAVSEGAELVAGYLGAKAFGGSRSSQIGAFVGTIVGAVVGSLLMVVIGTILGALLGGFLGALLGELWHQHKEYDGHDMKLGAAAGARAGLGAMLAKLAAIAIKATLATLMVAWFLWVLVFHLR